MPFLWGMDRVVVHAPLEPVRATIQLPRSKSVSNRALVAAALAGDLSGIAHLSAADDTRTLHHLLQERPAVMHCGLGGTTLRFLLAWAAVQPDKEHVITGDARLLERPHDELALALRLLGASITRTDAGYRVKGDRLSGGRIVFRSPPSSQYLSALMLVAPTMEQPLEIAWEGTRLSQPYVAMTARVMQHYGAQVELDGGAIRVRPGSYASVPFNVPCDWSAAAFWYAIAALTGDADIHLVGTHRDGWQGDEAVAELLAEHVITTDSGEGVRLRSAPAPVPLGARGTIDLQDTPDLFQALAFTFAALGRPVVFTGLDNLALKETDRIAAVADTLRGMGVQVTVSGARFSLEGRLQCKDQPWPVYDDHRMAMALAPLALACGSIGLQHPEVVSKSYPGFWEDLKSAGFGVELHS